jgi:hypothetical protein
MKFIVANNLHSNFEKKKKKRIQGKKCNLKIQKNDFLQYIEKITIREMIGGVWFP